MFGQQKTSEVQQVQEVAEQKGSHTTEDACSQEIQPEHKGNERQEPSASLTAQWVQDLTGLIWDELCKTCPNNLKG